MDKQNMIYLHNEMLLSHKMRSAIARKDPVNIILNERSQKEKATYCNVMTPLKQMCPE